MELSTKAERKRTVRDAKAMGADFQMHSFRRGFDKYIWTQGWGWNYTGNKRVHGTSQQPFATKYEAAMDFLKWALVNL